MKIFFTSFILLFCLITNAQNFVWAKQMGSTGYDYAFAITTATNGDIIVGGAFSNTVDFDPSAGITTLTSAGNTDMYIARYTSAGNFVWVKQIGNAAQNELKNIKCDASNNIYFTGQYSGSIDFNPGVGTNSLTSAGGNDIFIGKLDFNGNYVWAKSMGGTGDDRGEVIDIDNVGDVYTTGEFTGSAADFNPSATTNTLTSYGGLDIFLSKLDANGNYVWAQSMGGAGADYAKAIKINATNNVVYSTGTFSLTADLSPNSATSSWTATGQSDFYISKVSASNGIYMATKTIGGATSESAESIIVDASGSVYLTGNFTGACDFDPSALQYNLGANGIGDAFILKLDVNLLFVWAKQLGSLDQVIGSDIKLDSDQNIITSGIFNGTADFDPSTTSTYTITDNGNANYDAYIHKLDPNGNFVWVKTWGNTNSVGLNSITLDPSNNIYSVGEFFTTVDFDPSSTTSYSLTSNGATDAFIHKLSCTLPSTVTTISNLVPICIGSIATKTIALSSAPELGVTYSWSSVGASGVSFSPSTGTNTSISYTASTSFSVVVTATNACGTTTTIVQSITPYALPSITITASSPSVCVGDPAVFTASGASTYTWNPTWVINGMPTVNYGNGPFTVTATDANGCVNTNTVNFTEYPLPSITAASSSSAICSGNTATLSAGGASSYTWTSGPQTSTYNVSTAGTYTVTGTDIHGCVNTKTVSITVNSLPNVTAVASNTAICSGSSTTLTAGGASTYQWSGGPSTASYVVSTAGIYTVTGTNANACVKTKTVSLIVNSLPNISAVQSPSLVCDGNPATLSGTGATSYTWNPTYINGAGALHFIGEPTFTITGTDVNGCINSGTFVTNVATNPTVSITGKNTVCLNTPNVLTANGATTYTWLPGSATGASVSVQPTVTTTYTVNAKDGNGCGGSNTFNLNIVTPQIPDICEVTVDSLSQFNNILWNKASYSNVDSFIVYREVSTGLYLRIGAQDKNALSLFVDTARSIGPANGNPNMSSYRYKLQIRDTCGNYSIKSPYHNSIYFNSGLTGTQTWNSYDVEGQPLTPVTTFDLYRDNNATGTWTLVGSCAGTQTTLNDPAYAAYPNGIWRVYANGFNCNPTAKTTQQVNRSKSNVKDNFNIPLATKRFDFNELVSVSPNPASSDINVYFSNEIKEKTNVTIIDIIGKEIINKEFIEGTKTSISIYELTSGIYFIKIQQGKNIAVKKFIKQ